ncbi:MAG: response regulator with CheY-like receiver, AAA-type ATPase, and DNA-binding domain [Deltaproteobacteria bacterium]|jgi:DNA-binding NtrC family response regulator|nr:response regulator with CheY-like receiver, AAA-type ATPase, and DNA-binding domain [Deltaproteobacteria bacterium]
MVQDGNKRVINRPNAATVAGRDSLPYRILIADDEFLIRWSLEQVLIQDGHHVVTAEDGQKAIEAGRTTFFDFVITDIFMPESDGWHVLDAFSKCQPSTRVIIMTAYGEGELGRVAKEKGAFAYVEKPYLIQRIKDILRETST